MNTSNAVAMDIECLPNYFLVMFRKLSSGDVLSFEKFNNSSIDAKNILHLIRKYTIITFNGGKYDMTMLEGALSGFSNQMLYNLSQSLIEENLQPWQARRQYGIEQVTGVDHIDLINVAPLKASLKIYAGRLHIDEMMDMPIHHSETVTEDQLELIRYYCSLDLVDTEHLFLSLQGHIELREAMSKEYGTDLRSKSDAQIAEAVIKKELEERYDIKAVRPKIAAGAQFRYKAPSNISFESPVLQDILRQYTTNPITVTYSGYTEFDFDILESDRIKSGKKKGELPENKRQLKFSMGDTKYTIGIGGVHTNEKSARHVSDDNYIIREYDVASYYPFIILNNLLIPKHLGSPFIRIYRDIVDRRLDAKDKAAKYKKSKEQDKFRHYDTINESLKVVINGSFGKLGSKWSCLYAPDLMIQVTVTGQLTLLMLAERFEKRGISVVSANTDGIVVKIPRYLDDVAEEVRLDWEIDTGYILEPNDYLSLNSRDINNYIGVTSYGVKGKGAFADQSLPFYRLRSNPTNEICTQAAKAFLEKGIPVEKTIMGCTDIRQFVSIRTVNGGAVKNGKLIGKAIRWYYGAYEMDAIYYQTSGNKVPRSDGAVPLMKIPDTMPDDVDYDWYINEALDILKQVGYK